MAEKLKWTKIQIEYIPKISSLAFAPNWGLTHLLLVQCMNDVNDGEGPGIFVTFPQG